MLPEKSVEVVSAVIHWMRNTGFMTIKHELFSRFAETIAALPDGFASDHPLPKTLLIEGNARHSIYYAPFDFVNRAARLVLVGITPGRMQAVEALRVARQRLLAGASQTEAMMDAKKTASFAGPMRQNLIALLDHVGVAERLQVQSTSELWATRTDLVHFTSALRYPVFDADGKNYSGAGILRSELLVDHVNKWFGQEASALTGAMFVPLGGAALDACDHAVRSGAIRNQQVLRGLPHPSGANAERIAYFQGRKPKTALSVKTNATTLDAARDLAMKTVAAWSGA